MLPIVQNEYFLKQATFEQFQYNNQFQWYPLTPAIKPQKTAAFGPCHFPRYPCVYHPVVQTITQHCFAGHFDTCVGILFCVLFLTNRYNKSLILQSLTDYKALSLRLFLYVPFVQGSRTPPFHGGNTGSNPVRDAKEDLPLNFEHC